jgi:hypothetical protein
VEGSEAKAARILACRLDALRIENSRIQPVDAATPMAQQANAYTIFMRGLVQGTFAPVSRLSWIKKTNDKALPR